MVMNCAPRRARIHMLDFCFSPAVQRNVSREWGGKEGCHCCISAMLHVCTGAGAQQRLSLALASAERAKAEGEDGGGTNGA
jgi:hypothetical protein